MISDGLQSQVKSQVNADNIFQQRNGSGNSNRIPLERMPIRPKTRLPIERNLQCRVTLDKM